MIDISFTLILNITAVILAIMFLRRNKKVYEIRKKVGSDIFDFNIKQIENESHDKALPYPNDYGVSPNYTVMLFTFWKSLDTLEEELRKSVGLKS